ncbi:class I adenylate-forming enzyme family protein [Roseibium marinum]|uniref:Acyl-coenzyme A synthetase/AMP-(Fatty) acid ligase n=1 Tax=Roseibium marinum TaxID=281252 RepID=A0A2S3UYP5_9HYPH|nr:class I adenylate-forming enzyme family protein [Roseibium marinum]POF32848.1 acyl-coenzyme A synthetase/AMP-(fatty) acid ligase [Roseibium marinum]
MNLAKYCLTSAAADPGKTALEVVGPGGKILEVHTFGALTRSVLSVAGGLAAAGLQAGDRVLLRIGHSSDFPLLFFGAIAGGFVPVPTSALLTSPETEAILKDCGASMVLHDGKTALPLSTDVPFLGPEGIDALKRSAPAGFADTGRNDPAFLIYTSGTSGAPKGVLHAHRTAAARAPMYRGWYGISSADRLLHAGAFNWTYTLGVGLMDPWANGATSIVYDGPRDPEIWPRILEASRASLFAAVPSLYRRILKYGEVSTGAFPALRHGLTAGEALAAALYRDWKERSGRELYEALGMSEISTYLSSGPDVPVKPGSPGKPQAGRKVAILKEGVDTGTNLAAPEETGLLAIHRDEPGLMLEYWNRPQETAAAFRGDWFLTGDRARRDEDGYYWYEGRSDDLMNAFGYRVAPEEVERVLAADPQVLEVAVTAVAARAGVSLITAFVVPRDRDSFDADRLAAHAGNALADYKRPKAYRVVDQLPRTPSGKVRRKALGKDRN